MNKEFIKKLLQMKKQNRVKINGKTFTIQERSFYSADPRDKFEEDETRYGLGDNYFLSLTGERPWFYKFIEKKHLFGFTSGKTKIEKIETIAVL